MTGLSNLEGSIGVWLDCDTDGRLWRVAEQSRGGTYSEILANDLRLAALDTGELSPWIDIKRFWRLLDSGVIEV